MHELLLTGIRADTPIGAMAAFGLLRLFPDWRLSWSDRRAVVLCPEPMERHRVIAEVMRAAAEKPVQRPELIWTDSLKKVKPEEWERVASRVSGVEELNWLAALGAPGPAEFYATPFDMTSGSQKFLRELAALPGAVTRESVEETLFGPWRYRDSTHSLGWDPVMLRAGATTSVQPRELKEERGVTAAVWLASESLPLFPCFINDRGRLTVRGWADSEFRWAVWERPIGLAGLKAVIRNPHRQDTRIVYASRRTKAGRQPGFAPARAVFED